LSRCLKFSSMLSLISSGAAVIYLIFATVLSALAVILKLPREDGAPAHLRSAGKVALLVFPLRHRVCRVLPRVWINHLPVFHQALLPRCAATRRSVGPLVLGDPTCPWRAYDFGSRSGDLHVAHDPPSRRDCGWLAPLGGRRSRATTPAEPADEYHRKILPRH